MAPLLNHDDYKVAWIAVLQIELIAALKALDKRHEGQFPTGDRDDYLYIAGEINNHNIVVASLPEGQSYGKASASALIGQVKMRFKNIQFALLVGIAAGLPDLTNPDESKRRDIRLGDVLVCVPDKLSTGTIEHDLGKETSDEFVMFGRQAETPAILRSAYRYIRSTIDDPYRRGNKLATYLESFQTPGMRINFTCPSQEKDNLLSTPIGNEAPQLISRELRDESERTQVWYGKLGSGDTLMRDAKRRDKLRVKYDLIGLEMEAAGIMNYLPTGVIRGVCDYADAQKNDEWHAYAAAVAAVYAKGVLNAISPPRRQSQQVISNPERVSEESPPSYTSEISLQRKVRLTDPRLPKVQDIKISFWLHLTLHMLRTYAGIYQAVSTERKHKHFTFNDAATLLIEQNFNASSVKHCIGLVPHQPNEDVVVHKFCAMMYMLHMELLGYSTPAISEDRRRIFYRFALFVRCSCGCQGSWNFANNRGILNVNKERAEDCEVQAFLDAPEGKAFWASLGVGSNKKLRRGGKQLEQLKKKWIEADPYSDECDV